MDSAAEFENPYAPPLSDVDSFAAAVKDGEGLWRWGHLLVMRKDAQLPDVCLKTNQPAVRRLKRVVGWYHPAWLLLIFVNIVLFVLIALIVRKKAKLSLAFSEYVMTRRKRAIIGGWTLLACGLGGFYAAGSGMLSNALGVPVVSLSLIAILVAGLWASLGCRLVSAKRMTKGFIWLKGVHPEFLAGLPEWQTGFKAPA